jgi:hypothetical protein
MTLNRNTVLAASIVVVLASVASAAPVTSVTQVNVDTFNTATATPGTWYAETRSPGTAQIVSLTGSGGTLESGSDGDGVVRLTTTASGTGGNNDKSAVTTYGNFGLALTGLNTLTASYDYYRTTSAENPAAAPAFRIQLFTPGGTGDNFGTLVYEPYWNMSGNPSADTWNTATITSTSGLFWWNGGYEQPNSAGGPPLHTLSEWATLFAGSDTLDFAAASIVSYSTGLGSYNPGQTQYVDHISVDIPGVVSDSANFVVPEPVTMGAVAGLALTSLRRRRA